MKYAISIVIPTRNRAESLKRCLLSIEKQSASKSCFEVIVIDNGSTDSTKGVAESFSTSLNLVYCYAPTPGLHTGRHKGLELAQAEIITYIDDDIIAFPNWLEGIIESFKNKNVVMVGGNNIPHYESPPPNWLTQWWEIKNANGNSLPLLSILDFGEGKFEFDADYVWGCNFSVRKQIIIDAQGFHPDALPAEQLRLRGDGETHISDYIKNKGLKVIFNSKASVYHCVSKERLTVKYFEKRAFAQGISNSYTLIRQQQKSSIISYKFRMYLILLLRFVKYLFASTKNKTLSTIKLKVQKASIKGFVFHQQECKKDKSLLDWVLKEHYFE
ncbi:glycosyltransferase [Aliikangiella sp. IMCC44359]|uniref:glycosyltransferase n=1 Tax=Aliikangiella sp. IMCC44359 TaxID=3459125 RepID=UPI00403A905A